MSNYRRIINNADAKPFGFPNWTKALSNVVNGRKNATVLCLGDSTTAGVWADNASTGNWWAHSYPAFLNTYMNNRGIATTNNAAMGNGGSGGTTLQNNALVTPGSFSNGGSFVTGGKTMVATSNASGPLSYAPGVVCDTFDVYYIQIAITGNFNIDINGGTPVAVNANGSTAFMKATVTGSAGVNTLNITWTAGSISIIGWVGYNSAVKSVNLINAGNSGATAAVLANTGTVYAAASAIPNIAPDLTILDIGINDWFTGTAVSSFLPSVQTIISQCLKTGDVLLVTPIPSQPATVPLATQQPYVTGLRALAAANDTALYSFWDVWQPIDNTLYAQAVGAQLIHPNAAGYQLNALELFNVISNVPF